jgi:hypothetical protein
MRNPSWRTVLVVLTCLVFSEAIGAEWLLANRCRGDDCYLRWVIAIEPAGEGAFRVQTRTSRWAWTDDPPVLGEPEQGFYTVSCDPKAPFVESNSGRRQSIVIQGTAPAGDEETSLWNGVCRQVRDTVNRVD